MIEIVWLHTAYDSS